MKFKLPKQIAGILAVGGTILLPLASRAQSYTITDTASGSGSYLSGANQLSTMAARARLPLPQHLCPRVNMTAS